MPPKNDSRAAMVSVAPAKSKSVRKSASNLTVQDDPPEVRRAFEWLRREAEKVKESEGLPRARESSNAWRAVNVLADANVTSERLFQEQTALSTLASFLAQRCSENMQAATVGLLARAFEKGECNSSRVGGAADSGTNSPKRTSSAASHHRELQSLLGITYKAIASVLELVKIASGEGAAQTDAFALLVKLAHDNEETVAEAVRCDMVGICTRKMAAGENPAGQVAAAKCLGTVHSIQGLQLILSLHSLETLLVMLRSHAEPVKMAAISTLSQLAKNKELQVEMQNLAVFESIVCFLYEPSPCLVASSLRAISAFLTLGSKTSEDAARLRFYSAYILKNCIVEGVLQLGIHGAHSQELSLACIDFIAMSLKLLVPDEPRVLNSPAVPEQKKENVLDRKSRRGLNSLTMSHQQPSTTAQPHAASGVTALPTGISASNISSKPLIAHLLSCKELFAEFMICMLSTSIQGVQVAAMDLMTLSMERKRDFVSLFSVPSVCWALTSVCAREERDEKTREIALKKLVDFVRVTTGCGSHLHNKMVAQLAARYHVKLNPPENWVEHLAGANTQSLPLDLANACKMLLNKSMDAVTRSHVLLWMQCMIRADPTARAMLAASSEYMTATLSILKGDTGNFPMVYKAQSLRVFAHMLHDATSRSLWLAMHPFSLFRDEFAHGFSVESVSYLTQYLLRLVREQRRSKPGEQDALKHTSSHDSPPARVDPGGKVGVGDAVMQDVILGLGYVVIGLVRSDNAMLMRVTKMGLCEAAVNMLASRSWLPVRRLGAEILTCMCKGAPSLCRLVLSIGLPSEFIERCSLRSEHESFPPVLAAIFDVLRETEPAPQPELDVAALDKLSEPVRQKKMQDFEKFASQARREEVKRLRELEPLVVASLQALQALCGADCVQEAAGGMDGRWKTLGGAVCLLYSHVRLRCWKTFKDLLRLCSNENPAVVHLVLSILYVLAAGQLATVCASLSCGNTQALAHEELVTDSGLILRLLQQLDGSSGSAADTAPVVSIVHAAGMAALTGLIASVTYSPYLDKAAEGCGRLLRDAVVARQPRLHSYVLASFDNLVRCHPALRAPFYSCQGLERLYASLSLEDKEQSVFAAQAVLLLAGADVRGQYGLEIIVDLSAHFVTESSSRAIKLLVQLIQHTQDPQQLATFVRTMGVLGRHASLSVVVDSENGIYLLVRLLCSAEASVVAAAGMALADVSTDPLAFESRSKIKALGALPCIVSLLSSPDHLVQNAMCCLVRSLGQDGSLRPTLGKLDAIGHVFRLIDCTSCSCVQASAILSLVSLVQSATSAKRFMHLGGTDVLYRALRSNDESKMTAAASAIGAISALTDSDSETVFANIRTSFLDDSCYQHLLNMIEQYKHLGDQVTKECMRVFEAFGKPETALDRDFIDVVFKTIRARSEDARCTDDLSRCAMTVCSTLSQYSHKFGKEQRKWLVSSIQNRLLSDCVADKASACWGMCGIWWDKVSKDIICKRHSDLEIVYNMLKDARSRPAAASALEGLFEIDENFAKEAAQRGCVEHMYLLLKSSHAKEASQAAKSLASMCKHPASREAVLAEIPHQKKKEGIAPVIAVMEVHALPALKMACANCIGEVVQVPKWTLKVAEQASPGLIRMLQNTHEQVVLNASSVLTLVAKYPTTHRVLYQQGAVITLNALLTDRSGKVRIAGCVALRELACDLACNDLMLRIGTAKTLLDMMRKDDFLVICRASETMRTMMQLPNAQAEFLGLGGMDVVHALLDTQEVEVRKLAGRILVKVLLNPTNKAGFKSSKYFFKCLDLLARDADMDVRRILCEALATLAGNEATVNIEYKTALYEAGFVGSLRALLQDVSPGMLGVKTRCIAAKSLGTMCSIVAVQNDIQSMGMLDVLVPLLQSDSAQQVVEVANVIARAVRYHILNRQTAARLGLVEALCASMQWEGKAQSARLAESASPSHDKACIRARTAAADALSALLECPNCRRTYQGTRSVEMSVQGFVLQMPSVVNIYDCPHRQVCLTCARKAQDCSVLDTVLVMLQQSNSRLRRSAAGLLAALAIGAPHHGQCEISTLVCQQVLERGMLKPLLRMLSAKDVFDIGRAAGEQFAAARAIDSLATRDCIRYACCKDGFVKALVEMLFSTLGRIKGSASLALARLCASDQLFFYYNTQTEKTFWDVPEELVYVLKANGTRDYFAPEDVDRDIVRKGYWVRGIFKPLERIDYCNMLVATAPIHHGQGRGMHKMKADATIVTNQSVLDLILDIFKSPIYDIEVNGWAAEACAVVSEFHLNRRHIAMSGCVHDIVNLLYSNHNVWKEQAAIGLAMLMYDDQAKEIAGSSGVMHALTEILLSPYSSLSLKESAALAVAKACWNAANQVVGLESGAVMPLIAMLMLPDIREWCCAVEALMAMSSNHECRSIIGQSGAIPALVNKLTLEGVEGETAAQVRVLATLTNLVAVPANCDMAVDCGVLMRFIELTESHDVLLLSYLLIAMATTLRCDRWRRQFVESGLVQKLLSLIQRFASDVPGSQQHAAPLLRVLTARMMRDLSTCEEFKTSMVHLGSFPALKVVAQWPESEAQACMAACVANLAFSDHFKKQVRIDGLIPTIAHLMRKRCLEVQLETARAVRVLGCTHDNKLALVEAGALHGLRDMLDHDSAEARVRATAALSLLATNQDNAAALSKSGAVRPLVNLLDERNPQVLAGAAEVLAQVTRTKKLDTRAEVAAWGAIPKLSAALDGHKEARISLQVARTIDNLTTADQLSSKAANEARSYMLVQQRISQVRADATAKAIRQEMVWAGVPSKLKPLVDSSRDAATLAHASKSLSQIDGHQDL